MAFPRMIFLMVFLSCALLMAIALFMQHRLHLAPCSLCIFQRIMVTATGLIALVASVSGRRNIGIRIYGGLIFASSAGGAGLAARQLYLQHLPPNLVPSCGASLDYLMDVLPLNEVIAMVLSGDGACAEVAWTFLGLSLPGWLLIAFIGLMAAGISQVVRPKAPAPTALY